MTTTRAAKPRVRFVLPEGVPDLVRAASLALAVARHCKAPSWADFVKNLQSGDDATQTLLAEIDDLDPHDSDLIAHYDPVLRLLHVKPLVTVAVCPECQAWLLAGTAPTKCKVTLRCGGKPAKASIATKAKPESADPADPEDGS